LLPEIQPPAKKNASGRTAVMTDAVSTLRFIDRFLYVSVFVCLLSKSKAMENAPQTVSAAQEASEIWENVL
jgi:hypothetical protein